MEVILAGDIIGSRDDTNQTYLNVIETILKRFAKDGMYQIYRGDSFQIYLDQPVLGLLVAIILKAGLKRTGSLDVRIALGLGNIELKNKNIATSTGSALIRSGELLDSLKNEEQNIMVSSGHNLDHYMNTALKMALLYMDEWTANSAEIIFAVHTDPLRKPQNSFRKGGLTQKELGVKLGIKQASASRRLQRAHSEETDALLDLFSRYYNDISQAHVN